MRIGLNAVYLRPGLVGGGETYVRGILRAFLDRGHEMVVLCGEAAAESFPPARRLEVVPLTRGRFGHAKRLLAEAVLLGPACRRRSVDVILHPVNQAPLGPRWGIPEVLVIHDVQHMALPQNFSPARRLARTILLRNAVRRCSRVIGSSEYTRREILRCFRVEPSKVSTVLLGVDTREAPTSQDLERVRQQYRLPSPYFLFPSMIHPHKNHRLLLEAMEQLTQAGSAIHLVLSGKVDGWREALEPEVARRGLQGRVRHVGNVPREDVLPLLGNSAGLAFPSLFEGFGLPPLEAMVAGAPVLAARSTSLPEVVGTAGLLLDPQNPAEWASVMQRVVDEPDLRAQLVAKGREWARSFSWARCAAETEAVLLGALKAREPGQGSPPGTS